MVICFISIKNTGKKMAMVAKQHKISIKPSKCNASPFKAVHPIVASADKDTIKEKMVSIVCSFIVKYQVSIFRVFIWFNIFLLLIILNYSYKYLD